MDIHFLVQREVRIIFEKQGGLIHMFTHSVFTNTLLCFKSHMEIKHISSHEKL